jgi:hypothetical protein
MSRHCCLSGMAQRGFVKRTATRIIMSRFITSVLVRGSQELGRRSSGCTKIGEIRLSTRFLGFIHRGVIGNGRGGYIGGGAIGPPAKSHSALAEVTSFGGPPPTNVDIPRAALAALQRDAATPRRRGIGCEVGLHIAYYNIERFPVAVGDPLSRTEEALYGAKSMWQNERVAQSGDGSGPLRSKRAGRTNSRKDKKDLMAHAGMFRRNGECYGQHMHLSPSPFGSVVEATSQEKCHHESKAGNYCFRRIGVHGQRRNCTTLDGQSNSRSASVAYIRASL